MSESSISDMIEKEMAPSLIDEPESVKPTATDDYESDFEHGKYDFNADFQTQIVALQMRDTNFARQTQGLISPDYFDNRADQILVSLAMDHFDIYGRTLNNIGVMRDVLKRAIESKSIRDNEKEAVLLKVKELFKSPVNDKDYVADRVSDFARTQAISQVMYDSIRWVEKGDFARVEEGMTKALRVGQNKAGEAYEFFDNAGVRAQERRDIKSGKIRPNGIPIGMPQFDNLLFHKGLGKGELTVFMAFAKRGKTLAIWDFGKRFALQGYNVLGITLEVSKSVIGSRLDANVSGVTMADLIDEADAAEQGVKKAGLRAGRYDIYEFPSNSLTPNDVKNLIEQRKADGFVYDAVIVDYLDIMAPNRWMPNEIANSKNIWSDMRGIAQEENFVMLSATQTNREGIKGAVADDIDVADDINKIRIADLVMSINATEEEMKNGEARIFFAASRNQKSKITIKIKNDMSRMRFLTELVDIQ
jgi:replicative DNA helicase